MFHLPRLLIVLAFTFLAAVFSGEVPAEERTCTELRRWKAAEAHQGVAVDAKHFYAITNRAVGKYDKQTGKLVARWQDSKQHPLKHLNAGVVIDGRLYCAHSTWPQSPPVNSLEIWDAATLKHVDVKYFPKGDGALNWVDRRDGFWWVVFAYYAQTGPQSVAQTKLVKYDNQWHRLQSWTFPKQVLKRFAPGSNSGGGWGPDSLLYVSGHDHGELYALRLPKEGSVLELVDTVPIPITGQAFAWDHTDPPLIYGINRPRREVTVSRLSELKK